MAEMVEFAASDQAHEEFFAQQRQVIFHLAAELLEIGPFAFLLIQRDRYPGKDVLQVLYADWFEQVFRHPQLNSRLGVLKIVIPADQDDFHPGHVLADDLAQLQAVHKGHFDIGDEHVRLERFDLRQGNFAVRGFAAKCEPCCLPVDVIADAVAGRDLIFNEKDFIRHLGFPSLPILFCVMEKYFNYYSTFWRITSL